MSDVNPVKHVVDGVRALFLDGHITATVVWGVVAALGLVAAGPGRSSAKVASPTGRP